MITDIISSIAKVAQAIQAQAALVKANQACCRTLAVRVQAIVAGVQGLAARPNPDRYRPALEALQTCLTACSDLIGQHIHYPSRFKRFKAFVTASGVQASFKSLTEELGKAEADLMLSGIAEIITNSDQDRQDAEADHKKRDEMLSALEAQDAKLTTLVTDVSESHADILAGFASAKTRYLRSEKEMLEIKAQQAAVLDLLKRFPPLLSAVPDAPRPTSPTETEKKQAVVSERKTERLELSVSPTSGGAEAEADAYYNHGLAYEATHDYTPARGAFQQAIRLGHLKALNNMGILLLKGWGGPTRPAEAYQYFVAAAQRGYVRAMSNLGTLFEKGDGVEKNLPEALYWFEQAAKAGDVKAPAKCAAIRALLTPAPLPPTPTVVTPRFDLGDYDRSVAPGISAPLPHAPRLPLPHPSSLSLPTLPVGQLFSPSSPPRNPVLLGNSTSKPKPPDVTPAKKL